MKKEKILYFMGAILLFLACCLRGWGQSVNGQGSGFLPSGEDAESGRQSVRVYYSDYLGHDLFLTDDVMPPSEAEEKILPFMEDHKEEFSGKTVLDIGTGCGIIALYAARLGAQKVVATDIQPEAVFWTVKNAQEMGFADIIDARLVSEQDPTAYAVIGREEKFDIIISNPPYSLDLDAPSYTHSRDKGDLGFSIIRGLSRHLAPGGTAVLLYDSYFYHQVMVRFARHAGFVVAEYLPSIISSYERAAFFNFYVKRFAQKQGVAFEALKTSQREEKSVDADIFPREALGNMPENYRGLIIISHP